MIYTFYQFSTTDLNTILRSLDQVDGIVMDCAIKGRQLIVDQFHEPKNGQLYLKNGRLHRASAALEPPAYDEGNLERSMRIRRNNLGDYSIVAGDSAATYAYRLEFGTANARKRIPTAKAIKISAVMNKDMPIFKRPFMRPKIKTISDMFLNRILEHFKRTIGY